MTNRKPVTLHPLREMHALGEKIAMLTCYDACFARVLDDAGVDALLVGDSLGKCCRATRPPCRCPSTRWPTTRRASLEATARHGLSRTCLSAATRSQPISPCIMPYRLMQAGAHMVKLEGGGWTAPIIRSFVDRGIPVCAHLGFTPQSVHALGGYRVQGREEAGAGLLRKEAEGTRRRRSRALGPRNGPRQCCARSDAAVVHTDHRHWRRRGLQRAGAGAATTCSA